MTVTYELWNTQTGNLVGAFETEDAALETVRKAVESHGPAYVDSLLLGHEDDDGCSKKIARGAALAELVQSRQPGKLSKRPA